MANNNNNNSMSNYFRKSGSLRRAVKWLPWLMSLMCSPVLNCVLGTRKPGMRSCKNIEFKRNCSCCLLNGAVNVSDKMASYFRMDSEIGCLRKTTKVSYKTGVLRAKRLTVMA